MASQAEELKAAIKNQRIYKVGASPLAGNTTDCKTPLGQVTKLKQLFSIPRNPFPQGKGSKKTD